MFHDNTKKAHRVSNVLFFKPATFALRALSDSLRSHAVPFYIKKAHCVCNVLFCKTGDVLLSQAAARQVSSAQKSLTTVFEMGTGVASSL